MDLSVVVIHYKSPDSLVECLRALATDTRPPGGPGDGLETEIVVIDNDSRDDAPARLAAGFPAVRLIANSENVGYARAVNQGVAATRAPAVLILNPDCMVHPGALRALLDYLGGHPRTALAAPQILNPDGSLEYSARGFPSAFTFLFNRYSLLHRLFPKNPWSRRYLLSDWDHHSTRDVDWVSGACMLVRREAIDAVGGMDETFFMFNEDVDWCRRFHLGGWAVTYVPAATVTHTIGASRSHVAPRVIWQRHLGMIHYYRKHYRPNPIAVAVVGVLVILRAGAMIVGNAFKPARTS